MIDKYKEYSEPMECITRIENITKIKRYIAEDVIKDLYRRLGVEYIEPEATTGQASETRLNNYINISNILWFSLSKGKYIDYIDYRLDNYDILETIEKAIYQFYAENLEREIAGL